MSSEYSTPDFRELTDGEVGDTGRGRTKDDDGTRCRCLFRNIKKDGLESGLYGVYDKEERKIVKGQVGNSEFTIGKIFQKWSRRIKKFK